MRRTFGRCDHHQSLDGGAATNSSDSAQALTSMRQQPEGRLGQYSGMTPERLLALHSGVMDIGDVLPPTEATYGEEVSFAKGSPLV